MHTLARSISICLRTLYSWVHMAWSSLISCSCNASPVLVALLLLHHTSGARCVLSVAAGGTAQLTLQQIGS